MPFFKTRQYGIEELPDEDSSTATATLRNQLFEDTSHENQLSVAPASLQQALEAEARRGTAATSNAIATAIEAKHIGVITVQSLEEQTNQLEKVVEDFEVIHSTLDRAENTIEKLTKWKLRRKLEKPFSRFSKYTQKDGTGEVTSSEKKNGKSRKDRVDTDDSVRENEALQRVDSYSEYSSEVVRDQLKVQDGHLNELSKELWELKDIANGIGVQIDKEAQVLARIDAAGTTERIGRNTRRLRQGLRI